MSSTRPTIKAYLSPDLLERWTRYCRQHSTTSSSAIKQVVRKLTTAPEHAGPAPACASVEDTPDRSRRRMQLRLTQSEFDKIDGFARVAGESATQWVVNLIRKNLTGEPQLGMAELTALGQSNRQLAAIGTNLNQMARRLNAEGANADAERVLAFRHEIMSHLAAVNKVMLANRQRWVIR